MATKKAWNSFSRDYNIVKGIGTHDIAYKGTEK